MCTVLLPPGDNPIAVNKYTYLLTPWSRVLLEKLTGSAASQEIPRIFGTQKFITVLTSARHANPALGEVKTGEMYMSLGIFWCC
jgi:hypothetical protein